MLSPPANNDHNGWQPRAWMPAPRRFRYGVLESEWSPFREKALRGVHRSPSRPPLTLVFSVAMSLSH